MSESICPHCGAESANFVLASMPPKYPFKCGSYEGYRSPQCKESEEQQNPKKPTMRQYYYRNLKCDAGSPYIDCCICWWDEGTGPLAGSDIEPYTWREKPASLEQQLAQLKEWRSVLERDLDNARKASEKLIRERDEFYARAASMVMNLPPETIAGDVQRWRDEFIRDRQNLIRDRDKWRECTKRLAEAIRVCPQCCELNRFTDESKNLGTDAEGQSQNQQTPPKQ